MNKTKIIMGCSLLFLIATALLFVDFSRVDDVPYHQILEQGILTSDMFTDSDSEYDSVSDQTLLIEKGEGRKFYSAPIMLTDGDSLVFSFSARLFTGEKALITVDLYDIDYDNPTNECSLIIYKGEGIYCGEIGYSREKHPDQCVLRFMTEAEEEIEISDLAIDRVAEVKNGNGLVKTGMLLTGLAGGTSFIVFCLALFQFLISIVHRKKEKTATDKGSWYTEAASVVCLLILILGMLIWMYQRIDIRRPLVYSGGDEVGIYYLVKTIAKQGTTLVNQHVGGISGGDMFDYPYSDKLSFMIVKLISLFTGNVYLITNLFYFLNFFLNGLSAYYVCRKLNYKRLTALLIGVLFAFCPFIQMRYSHMWLTPLYVLPLACLVAIGIIRGSYIDSDGRLIRTRFVHAVFISFICAFTGLYYAFFSCALFAAAWVIRLAGFEKKGEDDRKGDRKPALLRKNRNGNKVIGFFIPAAFIMTTISGVAVNVLPNILYWCIHGMNPASQVSARSGADAEIYALKLVQMLLPRVSHRIRALAALTQRYSSQYPLVNENRTSAIGVVASVGFVISLILIFSRNERYEKGKAIADLNLSAFLIATVGGIGGLISVVAKIPMRCYNRLSTVIMFLSLISLGFILDAVGKKHRAVYTAIVLLLLAVGLFDQTCTMYPQDPVAYESANDFMALVDEKMNEGDMIFELPVDTWPTSTVAGSYRQFIGYIESDSLNWSYGAMEGREESNWQKMIVSYPTGDFVDTIKYSGYDGIYLDLGLYGEKSREEALARIEELTRVTGKGPFVSKDEQLYFWDIRDMN